MSEGEAAAAGSGGGAGGGAALAAGDPSGGGESPYDGVVPDSTQPDTSQSGPASGDAGANNNSNDNGSAAVAAVAANNEIGEMAAPLGVSVGNHGHDQGHDPAFDRPPDLAYNQGRFGASSPFQRRTHEYRPTARQRTIDLDEYFHKLRHEPYTGYEDLVHLVGHLDTFAFNATAKEPEKVHEPKPNIVKLLGGYLGISFAASNPRKTIKRANYPLGNLPLEILTYLACITDEMITNTQLVIPMHQTLAYNNIAVLNDVLMGTERVLTTPLPIAYSIAISQITWVYVFLLPFQLYPTLQWVTIPATVVASYIILGILFIGREIENPFGHDVNDLPLESYCAQISMDLDILASKKKHHHRDWVESLDNKVLYPISMSSWHVWKARGEHKMRDALRARSEIALDTRKAMMSQKKNRSPDATKSGDDSDLKHDQDPHDGGIGSGPLGLGLGRRHGLGRKMTATRSETTTSGIDEEANIGFGFFGSASFGSSGSSGSDLPGRINSTGTFNKE
ncbi:hypothetical protein SPBR_02418 [Sporothrix brasiliensis 5110]|uniref:Uncharacterized protein n=1 Tax=Sporothrix brasiliensis 5110 TaxID=1398154 RepID=A0A0C2FN96_9PEZI|nr:uncharacterized protein SPBR_02418 [Sporothrix brasiliensis 5110]KIH92498.1 hypothetical protein SPBR_02418 [Sporothrix brasiliensis 5110]